MDNINYSIESSSYFNNIFRKVITVLGILIEMAILYVFFTYIGKVILYIYCHGTCDVSDKNNCACYNYVTNTSYWINFKYSILESLLAVIFYSIYRKLIQ